MKLVVTTNGEKSAEVVVPRRLQTSWEGLNFRRYKLMNVTESGFKNRQLRSFTKTDDDGNAWKYASVSYGDGTEYSGYILEQALMYVAANPVYSTSSEAKTVYKGLATTAAVMDTIDTNEKVQVRGVVYRNNGTTWYGVYTGSTMGFIKSNNKVTLSDDLVYTRTHTEVVNDTVARKQFSHVRPQPAARVAIRCMRSL